MLGNEVVVAGVHHITGAVYSPDAATGLHRSQTSPNHGKSVCMVNRRPYNHELIHQYTIEAVPDQVTVEERFPAGGKLSVTHRLRPWPLAGVYAYASA